jgi:hypothetical protein
MSAAAIRFGALPHRGWLDRTGRQAVEGSDLKPQSSRTANGRGSARSCRASSSAKTLAARVLGSCVAAGGSLLTSVRTGMSVQQLGGVRHGA